jgi:4-hydroxy-3-methylbut-2-en-1-yl diphosphate reductase
VEEVGISASASSSEVMARDIIKALRRVGPVDVFTLPGQDEHIEFRVPVELLDVPSAKQIAKDNPLGHSPSAENLGR